MSPRTGVRDRISVLIVDDDPAARLTLEALLEDEYAVTLASGVVEARRCLAGAEFEVIVTDHQLADGTGAELLIELETSAPETIGILVTGFPKEDAVQSARNNSGMVLTKPCDPGVLLAYVRDAAMFSKLRRSRRRLRGAFSA